MKRSIIFCILLVLFFPAFAKTVPWEFLITDYATTGGGRTDNTAIILELADKASQVVRVVIILAGKFLVKGSILLKDGVLVKGLTLSPRS